MASPKRSWSILAHEPRMFASSHVSRGSVQRKATDKQQSGKRMQKAQDRPTCRTQALLPPNAHIDKHTHTSKVESESIKLYILYIYIYDYVTYYYILYNIIYIYIILLNGMWHLSNLFSAPSQSQYLFLSQSGGVLGSCSALQCS